MSAVRLFIADDHHALQEGVRAIIEQQPGWKVCGTAATGREAVESARKLSPDIVVLDLVMPELSGLGGLAANQAIPPPNRSSHFLPPILRRN